MKFKSLRSFGVFLILGASSFAWGEEPKLATFDVFLEPGISIGWGSFSIEDGLDEGTMFNPDIGGRGGLKLGPVYLGFEYRSASPNAWSDKIGVSDATRIRYPLLEEGSLTSIGPTVGFQLGHAQIWASILSNSMKRDLTYNSVSYEHQYEGLGSRFEVSFNVFKNLHIGIYFQQYEFNEYASTHPTDLTDDVEDLDPRLSATTYGLTISYFVPLVHAIKEGIGKL